MRLNSLRPAAGSKQSKRRPGRGIGSGLGKTGGRGHKGQTSRAGGFHKVGFEGGQMPLQRRLPKVGFVSPRANLTGEVRLSELGKVTGDVVTLETLRAAGVIGQQVTRAKVFASGQLSKAFTLQGVAVTKGARAAIEKAGGKVED